MFLQWTDGLIDGWADRWNKWTDGQEERNKADNEKASEQAEIRINLVDGGRWKVTIYFYVATTKYICNAKHKTPSTIRESNGMWH